MKAPKKLTDESVTFEHGDLVELPSGEIVRWQDKDHPPTVGDRGWYVHPQNANGGYTSFVSWDFADRSLTHVGEMWTCRDDDVRVRHWHGGLVAPEGAPVMPHVPGDSLIEQLLMVMRERYETHMAAAGDAKREPTERMFENGVALGILVGIANVEAWLAGRPIPLLTPRESRTGDSSYARAERSFGEGE